MSDKLSYYECGCCGVKAAYFDDDVASGVAVCDTCFNEIVAKEA